MFVQTELVICDACDKGFHTDCHKPALQEQIDRSLPWVCADCQNEGYSVGIGTLPIEATAVETDLTVAAETSTTKPSSDVNRTNSPPTEASLVIQNGSGTSEYCSNTASHSVNPVSAASSDFDATGFDVNKSTLYAPDGELYADAQPTDSSVQSADLHNLSDRNANSNRSTEIGRGSDVCRLVIDCAT